MRRALLVTFAPLGCDGGASSVGGDASIADDASFDASDAIAPDAPLDASADVGTCDPQCLLEERIARRLESSIPPSF